ncbi:MAG TPA: CHY zinc finger protein [Lacisediminihabitans sp.]|uniref:CHY zinc finger protein n=1 Tax=Lacisediminihabitans sp. TaxID=2787631 RepID=UPI002ED84818
MNEARVRILGPVVDEETRCIHYRTPLDVIAIRFACCGEFYPCHLCHAETADHPAAQWPVDSRDERAVVCGLCWHRLTIAEYLDADVCPACAAPFNPGCKLHTHFYFQA